MNSEFGEISKYLQNLMEDERIRPEPEFECFSKYFAAQSNEEFLNNDEIFNLTKSHGVQLLNDIRYWLGRSLEENSLDEFKLLKPQIPVLNPNYFLIEDFSDIITKLKQLPSEWTIIQITKKFSVNDIVGNIKSEMIPEIHITRFVCGEDAERIHPYSITVGQNSNSIENIFTTLQKLANLRREYFSVGRTCKKLYEAYRNTNTELNNFIKELETHVLKHWICLFHGKLEDRNLENETLMQIKNLIHDFCEKEKKLISPNGRDLDMIFQVTLSAHFLKNKDIFSVLNAVLYKNEKHLTNLSELLLLIENLKMINISKECALKRAKFNPVILILDSDFEKVPWEMITPLNGQQVCRISSFQLLFALFKYHEPHIKNGFRIVDVDGVFSLINPGKDLDSCEKQMRQILNRVLPWAETLLGVTPDPKTLISKVEGTSVYLYCGHGSGIQYLKAKDLKKTLIRGLILLFGCSSNIPRNCGGRTPHQNNTYTYIVNGCPCLIGCMQDVGSDDADVVCEEMLKSFMPSVTIQDGLTVVNNPIEPNILKAIVIGKAACSKYWSKSAFIARGIPCKTAVGDVSKIVTRLT